MKNKLLKRANGGFSLVELIVVIAIMAILVGVAVPVYSSYIEKSQKAKDEQMIDEIKHAIEIAGAANTFAEGESGMVVLSTNGVTKVEGTNIDAFLKQTFGNDYASKLSLAYDGWGNSGLTTGLTPAMALAIKVSSYMEGNRVDSMLSDVETMTGMASNLVGSMLGNTALDGLSFSALFTSDANGCILDTTAAKYGITKGDYATWEDWANDGNQTAYSNLLVLAAADESEKKMNDSEYELSSASSMILTFSSYYAFAATDPEFSAYLDTHLAKLDNGAVTNPTQGKAWYDELQAKAVEEGYDVYATVPDDYDETPQVIIDQGAFLSIMAGLGNPTDEQAEIIKNDLNNENLFTQGVVNEMYNDYLGAVDAMSGLDLEFDATVEQGQVAILYTVKNGQLVIVDTLPTK